MHIIAATDKRSFTHAAYVESMDGDGPLEIPFCIEVDDERQFAVVCSKDRHYTIRDGISIRDVSGDTSPPAWLQSSTIPLWVIEHTDEIDECDCGTQE